MKSIIKSDAYSLYLLVRGHLFRTITAYPGYIKGVNEPNSKFKEGDEVKLKNVRHGFLGVVNDCIDVFSHDNTFCERWYSHGSHKGKKSEEVIRFAKGPHIN